MLVEFNSNYRRLWMFPRAIRKIYPWKLAQICQILDQISLNKWDQDIQNQFSELLTKGNLKSQNEIRDKRSGGARTYSAQLLGLGLLYKSKNQINFTLAGKSLINFETPLLVLQNQILNHQYPSSYSSNRNVKVHPKIKIKPFVLVLKLLDDCEINYLTVDEFIFPVLYGHNNQCYDLIKACILNYRTSNNILQHIIDPIHDLHTPRSANKSNIDNLLKEVGNIANTCKNYLTSSSLAFEEPITKKIFKNPDFKEIIDDAIKSIEDFIPFEIGFDEQFLRNYGAWNKIKDNTVNITRKKLSKGEAIISSQFYKHIGNTLVTNNAEEFINEMILNFGFKRSEVENVIEPLLTKSLTFFESRYLELSRGGALNAREFETATAELFQKSLMIEALHTGNQHKKGVGGYSDIILKNVELNECAIIDTKASQYYTLSSADYAKMISNYIPNYKTLTNEKLKLKFILYVAGGFTGEIHSKLVSLYKESGIFASAINAKSLIEIAQLNHLNSNLIWEKFKLNKVLSTSDFKEKDGNI
ncbi:MAG: restriction endonuclease FokI C-terminal domain-containing protein [Bacteroidia bacterium]